MPAKQSELLPFLQAAVRNPAVIGAIAPSSPRLAERLAEVVPRTGSPTVVELGPGTGVVSSAIADRLPAAGRHIAVELDDDMIRLLGRIRPDLELVHGDAARLGDLLAARGLDNVDTVVSGLPWTLFPPGHQVRILSEIVKVLTPDGAFTTFSYLNAYPMAGARRFRRMLRGSFDEVLITRTVWRNLMPALTYVCRRPRHDRLA
ncbi:methyltransferase domain-containing protein [Allokutzneria sp. A3M-2-11 16]|uniref:class I SAM-dependent methyltransferase n=1 Tax=Allokutzneria sp. A3M-2-11 16 TaxID=2962043 RepID=UPI0020B68971|nr:methyltransferase domain-containing protein [Allokutzneria sp. A3M-2-11 16]MCP3802699.1 methyltransferase domain-containing protein [Allokutzneria sp. A3M-2-11 16]